MLDLGDRYMVEAISRESEIWFRSMLGAKISDYVNFVASHVPKKNPQIRLCEID